MECSEIQCISSSVKVAIKNATQEGRHFPKFDKLYSRHPKCLNPLQNGSKNINSLIQYLLLIYIIEQNNNRKLRSKYFAKNVQVISVYIYNMLRII